MLDGAKVTSSISKKTDYLIAGEMRSASMRSFTSTMDWETMKIGPDTALSPKEREDNDQKTGEEISDI